MGGDKITNGLFKYGRFTGTRRADQVKADHIFPFKITPVPFRQPVILRKNIHVEINYFFRSMLMGMRMPMTIMLMFVFMRVLMLMHVFLEMIMIMILPGFVNLKFIWFPTAACFAHND